MNIELFVDLFDETKKLYGQAALHEFLAKSEPDNLVAARHIEVSRIYWGVIFRNYEMLIKHYDFTSHRSKIMLHRNAAWSALQIMDYQAALHHVQLASTFHGAEEVQNYLDYIADEANRNLTAAGILKNSSFGRKSAS